MVTTESVIVPQANSSGQKIVAIDSQKLEGIQSCMYFYDLKFNKHLRPRLAPDYLERGSLIHEMLAKYYTLKKYRSRWHMNNKTHADIIEICINLGRHKANKMELPISDVEKTIGVFREYAEFWENDSWNNIAFVEQTGAKVLYESDDLIILYEVKIDLGLLKEGGTIVPVDHKSAQSRRDPNQMANQFKGYCWFTGSTSIIINEVGFQKTVKPVDKFRRHTLNYSQAMINEWVRNTIWWVRFALECEDNKNYPQNYTSCDKFSGCQFRDDACAQDPEVRDYKLNELYKIEKWDVGEKNL